ncbi:UPF0262 protein [Tistrella bauzanensis]|uniref:UPF0262 protein GCM10011505_37310 n=1 Tax=Tistrella bauzanensis TaxID=657419 RepID=A0ABQ1IV46_9PROT|nr:UPF0262 family protein [Tistrella bauzanensis]GGB52872.1 UPF0262 protein [Tistrella bauzanensis]
MADSHEPQPADAEKHRPAHPRIASLKLDQGSVVALGPQVEHERKVAIFDLLEQNHFAPLGVSSDGPFDLLLSIQDNRLYFDISDETGRMLTRVTLPIAPFRGIVKDYFMICESYFSAIKSQSPSQIEAIDMGRRGIHNEGSELLKDRLEGKVELDLDTARRLFTLLCVLHIRQ